jgi:putative acyl-CoA dehydrogenase
MSRRSILLRALKNTPAVLDVWFAELDRSLRAHPKLDKAIAHLKNEFVDMRDAQYRSRRVVDQLALTMQAHLLVQAGSSAVAEGFIASRRWAVTGIEITAACPPGWM